MPPSTSTLRRVYSAPSVAPTGEHWAFQLSGSLMDKPVKRAETRKLMFVAARSGGGLIAEPLETQSADAFTAEIARESVRKARLLQTKPQTSYDQPFWLKKERKVNVWH
eukprot:TRINITY_DN78511_c0_g1_i1.p1 TRINITY_DN78511_c0_g1~~TRINITY_DN78511_c0_g1_i1.p1  ORF type:complete len:122 (-),score=22.70 TRINITY_DN78511_c0_g1_i1:25-351(-)